MDSCRYCTSEGVYHVTNIRDGRAETYHVCELHAQEVDPKADGVTLPPACPKCGNPMSVGTSFRPIEGQRNNSVRIKSHLHCDACGHFMEAPKPGQK